MSGEDFRTIASWALAIIAFGAVAVLAVIVSAAALIVTGGSVAYRELVAYRDGSQQPRREPTTVIEWKWEQLDARATVAFVLWLMGVLAS